MRWFVAAALLGFALFGVLRARAVVEETWGPRSRVSMLGSAAIAIALLFVLAFARSIVGVVIAGVVLGIALYGGWRLRRV